MSPVAGARGKKPRKGAYHLRPIRTALPALAAGLAAGMALAACEPGRVIASRTGVGASSPGPNPFAATLRTPAPTATPSIGASPAPVATPETKSSPTPTPVPTATPLALGPVREPGMFISFGPAADPDAVRRVAISALGASAIDPGQEVTLQAAGYTALDRAAKAVWSWTQTGGGTSWPSEPKNPLRGSFCCRAGDKIIWTTERGRARSGTVTVAAAAGNGASASFPVVIRNVPPVFHSATASPLLAGDKAGTALTVAKGTPVLLELRFHDDNGALEEVAGSDPWQVDVQTLAAYSWQGSWAWSAGAFQTASPLVVDASASVTFGSVGTATMTWTFRDGESNRLVRTWEITIK